MFPKDAHFICRTCLIEFKIKDAEFKTIEREGGFSCPECGFTTGKNSLPVSNFFKFYPRFIKAIESMTENGFEVVQGDVFKDKAYRGYHISEIILVCKKCSVGTEICMSFIHHMPDFTDTFSCSLCQTEPKLKKHTLEFFRALKNIHEAPMKDRRFQMSFQWDVFRPLGLDPFDYQVADACYIDGEQ